jgi:hypothetical protein
MGLSRFNPIRLFKKAQKAWHKFKEELEARQDLDKALREVKTWSPPTDYAFREAVIERRYREVLMDISGESEEFLVKMHLKFAISYEDLYVWYMQTCSFPPEEACISIRHFGVKMVLKAISAGERDNT